LSIWFFLSLLKCSCFYRISSFIAILTKLGDWSFLFYWKKTENLHKIPVFEVNFNIILQIYVYVDICKVFPSSTKPLYYFLLQVEKMCCTSLPAPFTCPTILKKNNDRNFIAYFYISFLIRLIYTRLKHVHCHFTTLQLLDYSPDLTQRHCPFY
jgi:hypothetical protein